MKGTPGDPEIDRHVLEVMIPTIIEMNAYVIKNNINRSIAIEAYGHAQRLQRNLMKETLERFQQSKHINTVPNLKADLDRLKELV